MVSYPKKYFTRDIIDKPTPLDVWIQGTVEQTVGNDILIVSDSIGRVKVVKCESAGGFVDKNSLSRGTYCCIIGKAVKTKGLPEIQATKIIDLSLQPQMRDAWESEVKEADLVLQGKLIPDIN
ncbi:jg14571 [Pararge aegeria aegeria]|uniref:Jg14571 protein n=2 Tax=Pararge aegeria TaxID=116150 RepID=A0A8S4S6Q1_9NEOP|nr:jg14571 [Pararge aegeria aegeria]